MDTFSNLFGPHIFQAAILVAAPLLLAALGELVVERTGVINMSIEGMMALGAATGFVVVFRLHLSDSSLVIGVVVAGLVTAALGSLYAWRIVYRRADQITTGIAALILYLGLAGVLYRLAVGPGSSLPAISQIRRSSVPGLSSIPFLGPVFFDQNVFVYAILIASGPIVYVLFRTPLGLRLRASGENPKAVDSLGWPVLRYRFWAIVFGSGLVGIAGSFIPLCITGGFSDQTINGRGWLALLLVIFARWRAGRIFFGALLFAYVESLQYQLAVTAHSVPPSLLQATPYIVAILALTAVRGASSAPNALGVPYDREARYQ